MNFEKFNSTFDYFKLCTNESSNDGIYTIVCKKNNTEIMYINSKSKIMKVVTTAFGVTQEEWDEIVYIIHKIDSLTKTNNND